MLPLLLVGGTAGAFYLRLHRAARSQNIDALPRVPAPAQGRRLLILAPHCDDETLGLGATIADARRRGVPVTVAFLTNGDGFRVAAGRELNEVQVGPTDFIEFAERRQHEALRALGELGVPEKDVVFLGYPDRGLHPMWERHRDSGSLFRSGFTGHTHSPYPRCFTRRTPYCGDSVLTDIERLLKDVRPTDLYVTHPADDHPDHSAAAAFAQAALGSLRAEPADLPWAGKVRTHYYIVHRGDWPLPQGLHPDRPLAPPPGLASSDTLWSAYVPTDQARVAKARALDRYASQMRVSRRFLTSFLRSNELVGEMPEPSVSPSGAPAHVRDAAQDDVARYVDPAADLTGITVRERDGNLDVRLNTRGPASPRVSYTLRLRSRSDEIGGSGSFTVLHVPVPAPRDGARRPLVVSVPLSRLGPGADRVWVAAESRWEGADRLPLLHPVDRIGYRPFRLGRSTASE